MPNRLKTPDHLSGEGLFDNFDEVTQLNCVLSGGIKIQSVASRMQCWKAGCGPPTELVEAYLIFKAMVATNFEQLDNVRQIALHVNRRRV